MTHYRTDDLTAADIPALVDELVKLRLATAHLAAHGRAVLEAFECGGLAFAYTGFPAYRANSAIQGLTECVTRAMARDWLPLAPQHIDQAWDRHAKRPLWGEEYMTSDRFRAALNDLLWHPERQFSTVTAPAVLPLDGTAGYTPAN
jgi:hypothetical protein